MESSPAELERLANAVIQPGFTGTTAPDWVRRRIADGGLKSVVLFGRNIVDVEQVAALTAELRAENPELIIGIDEEAGDVTRLEAGTGASRPGNLALGAVDDLGLTQSVARDIGRDLHAAGVSVNFAPSADVNSNPLNPVIGVRSFGESTDVVARNTAAWVRGLQEAGVAACVKHFPGHGDTVVDSHHGLPLVNASVEEIAATALPPFLAAMEAGVRAVMTGHVLVPAYDAENPATLSPAILAGLLRDTLGFTGLLVTDGIEMRAVTDVHGIDGATVKAIIAGVDAVCVGGESAAPETAELLTGALVRAVRDGSLPYERLARAAAGVGEFATWSTTLRACAAGAGAESGVGLAAARRAVRVTRGQVRPITGAPHVVELSPVMNLAVDGSTPWGVAAPLRELIPGTTSVRLTQEQLDGRDDALRVQGLGPAGGRPLVVVVRDAARHRWMTDAVATVLTVRPDATVVEMGFPSGEPLGAVHLITHGATRVSGIAAAEVLVGALAGAPAV
ncbi:Beta-hexosaminidase [Streptomyces sp. RB5]|uniref:Beta-hexosaminidase n=1 Tax=Streptomyces smaragdinus TaxID=2585196 RepID=A0A7K0CMJ6_9ACTN|nr:glycoside hydrolase family 3 N-terminal domain-containing protein [Streptomyces smaragdinus]MQY14631.1 Beta-hexosaminidase [Streptomyces smaragdinus]